MYSFNLIDKPWIPCIMTDGSQQELNLKETLTRAHEIQEIFAQSPIVTVALHRLLLALVYRNFPFENLDEWEKHWKKQNFCQETIRDYFDKWHDRFDLFHSEWPFYQRARFVTKKATPIKRLGWEFASGNNATLFDHSWDEDQTTVSPALAAQWVLATQAFAASAGKSETLHTKDSPWTRGAIVLMQGDSLFQTLALNLLHFHKLTFQTFEDLPIWEKTQAWQPELNVTPKGILDLLTWQSRSIYLLPSTQIKECYFAQGCSLNDDWSKEPMYSYRKDEKIGLIVWQFQEDKAIWRDCHTLFNFSQTAKYEIPKAIRNIATLIGQDSLDNKRLYKLQLLGQCLQSGQPTVKFWRQERLPIPATYLQENNKELLDKLEEAIKLAETIGWKINLHLNKLAQLLIASNSDQKEGRKPDSKDVNNLVAHFGGTTQYWAQLEPFFKILLVNLPEDKEFDEHQDITYGTKELKQWAEELKKAVVSSFLSVTNSLDTSSRALKAVAKAEEAFLKDINIALSPYLKQGKAQST